MSDEKFKKFMSSFYNQLSQDNWGDIDPLYFNPEYIKNKSSSNETLEARLIHNYVRTALEEIE